MARTQYGIDAEQFDRLQQAISNFAGTAGQEIDDVLHTEGGKEINNEIMNLLPESGRKWKGKKTAAKRAQPFTQEDGSLSVTVKTKYAYHYLYFPDDGTSTKRHVGYKGQPREFMMKGAENKTEKIMDLCINRLINKWEGE